MKPRTIFSGYCLACFSKNHLVFSVILKTNAQWLRKALKRNQLLGGADLTKKQVRLLYKKLPLGTSVGFDPQLEYSIEFWRSYTGNKVPDKTTFQLVLGDV